jgi:cell division protein FtsB
MEIRRQIRRHARQMLGPAIGLCLSGYFGYHLVVGERGLLAWTRLSQELRASKLEAARVHAERTMEEQRVSLLRADHLDPDMLDEQARAALNLVAPGEVVILNNDGPK